MAVSVQQASKNAIDLSPVRLRNDVNDEARGWKAEKGLFGPWHRQGIFIYFRAFRSAVWSAQPPIQWVREDILLQ
jgi:hypothetical protein